MPEPYTKARVRRLKNLVVNEVSIVNRAANQHAQIVLAKREEETMPVSMENVGAKADKVWNEYIDIVAKQYDLPHHKAVIKATETEQGRAILRITKIAGLHKEIQFQKLGGATGFKPDNVDTPSEYQDAGGKVHSRTETARHGGSNPQPFSPHDSVSDTATAEATLDRLRRQHMRKEAARFHGIVQDKIAEGASRSDATAFALRECPDMKGCSAADMIEAQRAAERDANQLRRSPGADGVRHNGSNQRGLGVTSNPNRAM
jgi:hypothetical protein